MARMTGPAIKPPRVEPPRSPGEQPRSLDEPQYESDATAWFDSSWDLRNGLEVAELYDVSTVMFEASVETVSAPPSS